MHYTFPIVALNREGNTRLLYSAKEVLDFVQSTRKTRYGELPVGEEWNTYPDYFYPLTYCPYATNVVKNDWILRDDRGRSVDWKVFKPAPINWKNHKGDFEYRNGPVPHRCGYRGCYKYRAPAKKNGGKGVLYRAEVHKREFEGRSLTNLPHYGWS